MSLALSQTLAEIDALNALSETLKQEIDKHVMEARVSLEKMAVFYEGESEGEFKELLELTAHNNQAIRWASERGHMAVVELLKAHGCVLPQ